MKKKETNEERIRREQELVRSFVQNRVTEVNYRWGNVMTVIEDIEDRGFTVDISNKDVMIYKNEEIVYRKIQGGKTKIEAIWKAIVKFIEWYNKANEDKY